MTHRLLSISALVTTSVSLLTSVNAEPLWPEFRGPTAQGLSSAKGLPTEWSKDKNIAWRAELPGLGWSTPIVANGKVLITNATPLDGTDGRKGVSLRVLSLDAASGKVVWDTEFGQVTDAEALKMHKENSQASPSVVFESGKIYAHFGHHGTGCLDEAGKILWSNHEHNFKPVHGTGGSPVIVDDLLIFNNDADANPGVVALNKKSGKTVWRTLRESGATRKFSFSTPLVIEVNGKKQVITPGSGTIQALDPKTGKEIWHVNTDQGYSVVPRPVFAHGLVFIASGFNKAVAYAIKPDGQGDVTETHVVWTSNKHVPLNASMVVVGDELYMLDDGGFLSCLDAKTGDLHYQERVLGPTWSSLIYADGHIYGIDKQGKTAVVTPGKELNVVATNDLGEKAQASFSVCDNDLLIRTDKALYRLGKR